MHPIPPEKRTNNTRIIAFEPLDTPQDIKTELPTSTAISELVLNTRQELRAALDGQDQRLVAIVGPCSIHDTHAALEYAQRLVKLRQTVSETMIVIMRVYFEKPRTTIGWKGLINDPCLDGTHDINLGLRKARKILMQINALGLPCAMEFLDPVVPQYTAELVSWAAIGARTTESQTHREMASGLSMPVGFKNATDGGLQVALDAMTSARHPHAFLGIGQAGATCIVRTTGNPDVHLVLRGGSKPNCSRADIAYAKVALEDNGAIGRRIMVDCSHGNSNKDYTKQPKVFNSMLEQILAGERAILGMMLESNLVAGSQPLKPPLTYGQSITDGCIDWDTTEKLLMTAHEALLTRRRG